MEIRVPLLVKRLSQVARLPSKGSKAAAGYDLYSAEEGVVPARGKALIKTGISIAVPPGNYGRVAPRSGLAVKNFIDVGAGVIDEDYRGEVGVVLFNHSEVEFKVNLHDRIAQLIIEKITDTNIQEVNSLDETSRGAGGFGSTGVAINSDNKIQPEPTQTNGHSSLKRKAPYGSVLSRDTLFKEAKETMNDEFQWKEWSVLVLYTLCESDMITVEEKKRWGDLVFSGQRKAYELLRNYVQGTDLNLIKEQLNQLTL